MSRGRNDADIISRLQFNGEGFSREYKKLTAGIAKHSKDAAQSASTSFVSIDRAAVEIMESARRSEAAVAGLSRGLSTLKGIAGAFGVGLGVYGLANFGKSVLDFADDLATAADQANINIERYQTLRGAFRMLEVDTAAFDKILKRLIVTQGDVASGVKSEATRALDTLGVSAKVVSGQIETTDQLIDGLAEAFGRIEDPARRAALAADIVGQRMGAQFAAAIGDGGKAMKQAEQDFRDVGDIIDEQLVQRLADANESWDRTLESMKQRGTLWAGEIIEMFNRVGDAMDRNRADFVLANKNASDAAQQWAQDVLIRQNREGLSRLSALSRFNYKPEGPPPAPATAGGGARARDTDAKAADALVKTYERQLMAAQRQLELQEAALMGREDEVRLAHELLDIEAEFGNRIAPAKVQALKDAKVEYAAMRDIAKEISDFDVQFADFDRNWEAARQAIRKQEEENARRAKKEFDNLADIYERAFRDGTDGIWDTFKSLGKRAIAEVLAAWTLGGTGGAGTLLESLGVNAVGGAGGLADILGLGGGQTFRMIESGVLPSAGPGGIAGPIGGGTFSLPNLSKPTDFGSLAGQGFGGLAIGAGIGSIQKGIGLGGSSLGGAIGGAIGSFVPIPGGSIIGSVLGSTIGGLLGGGAKTSNATLTGMGTATTGGKGGKQDQALGLAGSVQDGLRQIADALGVDVGSFYTTIGLRGGDYRVNTAGTSLKTGKGARDFGDDAQAAIEYAIRDAIGDGAFSGRISAAAERALKQTGKSIEKAIEDALTIESIPKRLKEIEDPIGAALDAVNAEFAKLRDTLVANGASAQQLADAEKLYGYEREAALKRTESTLRDFLDSLKVGGNSPLSLRDQMATAEEAFGRYEADIAAGKAIDQSGFAEAAQTALDIKQRIDGSTQGYFDLYNRVVAAGGAAQGRLDSTAAGRTDSSPFAKPTAEATAETANNTATLPAILAQLQQISAQLTNGGAGALVYGNFGFMR